MRASEFDDTDSKNPAGRGFLANGKRGERMQSKKSIGAHLTFKLLDFGFSFLASAFGILISLVPCQRGIPLGLEFLETSFRLRRALLGALDFRFGKPFAFDKG